MKYYLTKDPDSQEIPTKDPLFSVYMRKGSKIMVMMEESSLSEPYPSDISPSWAQEH